MLPIWEVPMFPWPGEEPTCITPFSPLMSITNWKQKHKSFSENLCDLIRLLESIYMTHLHTWVDIQQLLITLFIMDENDFIQWEDQRELWNELATK